MSSLVFQCVSDLDSIWPQSNVNYLALSVQLKLLEEEELGENGQTPLKAKVWHWESIRVVERTTQGPWHPEGRILIPRLCGLARSPHIQMSLPYVDCSARSSTSYLAQCWVVRNHNCAAAICSCVEVSDMRCPAGSLPKTYQPLTALTLQLT